MMRIADMGAVLHLAGLAIGLGMLVGLARAGHGGGREQVAAHALAG